MIIERTEKEIIVRIPLSIGDKNIQRILNLLRYQEITGKSKAIQKQADTLAKEVNNKWWKENKTEFLNDSRG